MKKPTTVLVAEAALATKQTEIAAAKETLKQLNIELQSAYKAITDAQTEVDAKLPQCLLVQVSRHSGNDSMGVRCVIVRQTPTGMLVVRRVGENIESRFKWDKFRSRYREATTTYWMNDREELRDVPAEYMPKGAEEKSA